jgi:hypothetical protein
LTVFSKLQRPLTLAFLQTIRRWRPRVGPAWSNSLQRLRHHHHPTPDATAHTLHKRLHQPQVQADASTTRTKSRLLLLALVSQLAPRLDQIQQDDGEIPHLFLQHPDRVICSRLPRAGQRLAPWLLAGWGDERERYGAAASVQAVAGPSPVA